jgi:MFS family permease
MLWPGTLIATSAYFPLAGSWIFALLAASGDIGAAIGPWITSIVIDNSIFQNFTKILTDIYHITREQASIRIGILFAVIFPLCTLFTYIFLKKRNNRKEKQAKEIFAKEAQ